MRKCVQHGHAFLHAMTSNIASIALLNIFSVALSTIPTTRDTVGTAEKSRIYISGCCGTGSRCNY